MTTAIGIRVVIMLLVLGTTWGLINALPLPRTYVDLGPVVLGVYGLVSVLHIIWGLVFLGVVNIFEES